MKKAISEWDKKLQAFQGLSYEDKLEYWISNNFYRLHYCRFTSDSALKKDPSLKNKIAGKKGEFSIIPQNELENELYAEFLINYLDLFIDGSNESGIKGLKILMEELNIKRDRADDEVFLFKDEREWIQRIIDDYYRWGGGDLLDGNYASKKGLPLIDINFNPETPINYFYFYGATLSKYDLEIRKLQNESHANESFSPLNLTERIILIEVMRETGQFPKMPSINEVNYKFLCALLNANIDQVENKAKKADEYFNKGKKIRKGQIPPFVLSARKVRAVLLELGNQTLITKIDEIIARLEQAKTS